MPPKAKNINIFMEQTVFEVELSCMYVCMYVLTPKAFHIWRGDYGLDPSIMGNNHAGRGKNTQH